MVFRATGHLFLPLDPRLYEIKGRIILKWMGSVYQIHVIKARDKWQGKGNYRGHAIQ
jgi:hypothetical protein